MLIIIISRSSLKLDHVGSKTRLLGHQATQVSDLGPLWPSCLLFFFGEMGIFNFTLNYFIVSETPGSMEELLERQWEQGSQFLMEQGQHFDSKSCTILSLP